MIRMAQSKIIAKTVGWCVKFFPQNWTYTFQWRCLIMWMLWCSHQIDSDMGGRSSVTSHHGRYQTSFVDGAAMKFTCMASCSAYREWNPLGKNDEYHEDLPCWDPAYPKIYRKYSPTDWKRTKSSSQLPGWYVSSQEGPINARRHRHLHRHLQENQRQGLWEAFKRSCRHRWTAVCFWRIIPRIVSYRKEHRNRDFPENDSMYCFGLGNFCDPLCICTPLNKMFTVSCKYYTAAECWPHLTHDPCATLCSSISIWNFGIWAWWKSSKPEVANKNRTLFNYRIVSVKYRSVPHFFVATQPLFAN